MYCSGEDSEHGSESVLELFQLPDRNASNYFPYRLKYLRISHNTGLLLQALEELGKRFASSFLCHSSIFIAFTAHLSCCSLNLVEETRCCVEDLILLPKVGGLSYGFDREDLFSFQEHSTNLLQLRKHYTEKSSVHAVYGRA